MGFPRSEGIALPTRLVWWPACKRPRYRRSTLADPAGERPARRLPFGWGTVLGVLGAAVLLFIVSAPGEQPATAPGDGARPAGPVGLVVVVDRAGVQTRHDGYAALKPGDALRLELTVATGGRYVVGVMEGREWTPLAARWFDPGAHLVDVGLTMDAKPTRSTAIAGPAAAVGRAAKTRDFAAVATAELVYAP